jgi:Flp pilus assembly pilin Flp
MLNVMRKLWKNEGGFVISVELILIVTILVIGLVSGWTMLRDAVLGELHDTAKAIGNVDQSFAVSGANFDTALGASSAGFGFIDATEAGDATAQMPSAATGLTIVAPVQGDTSAFAGAAGEGL